MSVLYLFQQFLVLLIRRIPRTAAVPVLNVWPDQGLMQTT